MCTLANASIASFSLRVSTTSYVLSAAVNKVSAGNSVSTAVLVNVVTLVSTALLVSAALVSVGFLELSAGI